ncbi:MAG TPA: hypothetical protein VFD59_19450 [Nocardioidaceae bacterium]|nr:hypothetical protein [Nocardioidaceae bacterium]
MSDTSKSKDEAPAKETDADSTDDTSSGGSKADGKATKKEAKAAKREERKQKSKDSGKKVKAGSDAIRSRIASVVWLIAVVCALFLAIGALLIALDANQRNSIVEFILAGADFLDGPFSRKGGLFTFEGKSAETQGALVNWGIAAVVYLVVGKILDKVIRP